MQVPEKILNSIICQIIINLGVLSENYKFKEIEVLLSSSWNSYVILNLVTAFQGTTINNVESKLIKKQCNEDANLPLYMCFKRLVRLILEHVPASYPYISIMP